MNILELLEKHDLVYRASNGELHVGIKEDVDLTSIIAALQADVDDVINDIHWNYDLHRSLE